ncbi:MAG TPA: asparagine--tRNA ligase [Myxococcaceae bacterium]|nr:asparagine--tRNA ligase [Myxococcaceae bacterium]
MSAPVVRIADIAQHVNQEVELRGWLYNKRSSGKLHFLQIRDGSGIIQAVVFKGDVAPEVFERADHIGQETSLIVRGLVREDKRSPIGFELSVKSLEVVQEARDYPISPKEHGVAYLMEHRHLWLRSSRQTVILSVRATVEKAIRDFFDQNGFTLVDAPVFTPAACEGTSTLFEVPYFDLGKAYLTQSGQLYMEAAAMALGKVYCFGPTFRAEKSKTRRHLTEFWMVEPEVAYMDLEENMDLAENLVCFVLERALEKHRKQIESVLERPTAPLANVKKPFPRITYSEAIERLQKAGRPAKWGDDFGGDEETVLASQFDRPVIIHRYPADLKAFYFKRDPQNAKLALGMDVLAPEGYGEIIGGGQREDDLDTLEQRIDEFHLPREAFSWYLDLRRYGSVPHSGFGMGIERTVAWVCGLHHVRETIPFARMMERITP